MRRVEVEAIRIEMPENRPVVLLRDRDRPLVLPIWIGAPEAAAIAFAQQGVQPPRPLTHDLFIDVIAALGEHLNAVHITELREGTFYATLNFTSGVSVSARPSDAIALALRCGATILVADDVMDDAGAEVPPGEEQEVERFREFLDQVSAEDFETGTDEAPDSEPRQ